MEKSDRKWVFRCDSVVERDGWTKAINAISRQSQQRDTVKSVVPKRIYIFYFIINIAKDTFKVIQPENTQAPQAQSETPNIATITTVINDQNVQSNQNDYYVSNFTLLLEQAHISIVEGTFDKYLMDEVKTFLRMKPFHQIIPALDVLNVLVKSPIYASYFSESSTANKNENGVLLLLHKINDCVNTNERTIEGIYLIKIFEIFTTLSYTNACLSSIYKPDKQQQNNIFDIILIIMNFYVYIVIYLYIRLIL